MVALTKSEMAERLFEELGLNKREAKEIVELFFEETMSRSSCRVSVISTCVIRASVPVATLKPVKRFRFPPAGLLRLGPVRS